MRDIDWTTGFPGSITVCNLDGIILEMNERAAEMFRKDGGRNLIGKNLLDCHPEPSRSKLQKMLQSGESNIYTIEKNGIKKLIYQVPWVQAGKRSGLVELALEIPFSLPHFVRK